MNTGSFRSSDVLEIDKSGDNWPKVFDIASKPVQTSTVGQAEIPKVHETAAEVHFRVEELDLEQLTKMLREFEKELGYSTVQMFHQYYLGQLEDNEDMSRWFDLFFLYLGTPEVKRLVCV